jgi:Ser/Thr protein kinase RdoA (MazF antagonist)
VIADRLAGWNIDTLPLERQLFGTDDPDALAAAVDEWCRAHLGAAIANYEFFDASSGSVHGVTLADGRRVVVKGHRPALPRDYLVAVHEVQRTMAARGCAAPVPLVAPVAMGHGHVSAESMLGPFPRPDAHAPAVRAALATGLAQFIARGVGVDAPPHPMNTWGHQLYPEPHSPRFDFEATAAGAEWIDALAAKARDRLRDFADAPRTLVHGDWRIENVRVAEGDVVAIYDWDSIGLEPETHAVATAARTFCCDWDRDDIARFPAPSEIAAFVADYETARGAPFTAGERDHIAASIVASLAYGARCEHSIGWPVVPDSQQGMLRDLGSGLLSVGLKACGAPTAHPGANT